MDAPSEFWIRVLLVRRAGSCTVKAASGFSVSGAGVSNQVRFGAGEGPGKIEISDGRIRIAGRYFEGKRLTITPERPYIFNFNGDDYRGKVEFIINSEGNRFMAINLVPLEPYLAGVIGAEMPHYWEPAALEAQTIAARTYCLYIKNRHGVNRSWDVKKTAANQVYKGLVAESASVWDAVNRTKGRVLFCRQADGTEEIFPAYYSSACGGHTENSKNVFGDSFEPLVGVKCPYCRKVTKPTFFFWPMFEVDKESVTKNVFKRYPKLENLGEVKQIISAKEVDYKEFSRVVLVKLVGSSGKSGFLRAEDMRLSIDPTGNKLRSTIFQIADMGDRFAFLSGRGYGHGVGMCQCGAQGLARRGRGADYILYYYYPGSKISRVY